ncbi:TIGR02265 family protein [Archangium sp.]|uniref:TIGR02265 family protein n=1 Tax=Archangium sp. TaxID=1872627 RepID=UPI0038998F48
MSSTSTAQPTQGPGAQRELEQRLAALGPKDTTRGFLFGSALEVVKSHGDLEALKRCTEAAGGGSFTAFFSYPVNTFLKLTYACANELSGRYGGFDGAMQQLGFRVAPRFLESTTGKMLLSLVGKEPKRLVDSMPTAYKTAWDHGTCSLVWSGPKSGRLTYVNAVPVHYFAGSVLQILAAAQLKNTKAIGRQLSLTESTVDFSWE